MLGFAPVLDLHFRSGYPLRMSKPVNSRTRSGFTLLELLVVIAIITLLISLLFPALGGAPPKAGNSKEIKRVMMAMTTNNSNNVKPERVRELTGLDIRKGYPDLKCRSRTGAKPSIPSVSCSVNPTETKRCCVNREQRGVG